MSWGMIAAGVGTAAAGYFGSKAAKDASKPTKGQREIEEMTAKNMRETSPIGLDFLRNGQMNMKMFNDFYRKLASGDRAGAMSLLAPQLRMADQQNAAALGSDLTLNPRGGGSAERRLAGMDALKAGREDAFINLRTGAVDTLGAMGGEMSSLGGSLLGQTNNGGLGLLGAMQARRNAGFEQGRAIGSSMGEIMKLLGSYSGWNRPSPTPTPTPGPTMSQYTNWGNQAASMWGGF
jgi:hypothetical protein